MNQGKAAQKKLQAFERYMSKAGVDECLQCCFRNFDYQLIRNHIHEAYMRGRSDLARELGQQRRRGLKELHHD